MDDRSRREALVRFAPLFGAFFALLGALSHRFDVLRARDGRSG